MYWVGGLALTISLIRIAFGMSMSDYFKEVVEMSEGEKEDKILIKAISVRNGDAFRNSITSHHTYNIQRERHASKVCLVGHLHDKPNL